MKFNVEINLHEEELQFLIDYDWFQDGVDTMSIAKDDKFIIKELINYHNILKIEIVDNGGFLSRHYLKLTPLGEQILKQYNTL